MQIPPEKCPSCQSLVQESAVFCGRCGYSLTGKTAPQQILRQTTMLKKLSHQNWLSLKPLILFYGFMLMGSFALGVSQYFIANPITHIIYWCIDVILIVHFGQITWAHLRPSLKFKKPELKLVIELAGLCVASYLFLTAYFKVFELLGISTINTNSSYAEAGWPVWSFFVMTALLPGVIEEIAFRGIIQSRLQGFLFRWEAIILQAALFSVIHLSPAIFVSHFVMGLLLGWARHRFGHIYFGIILHILWNSYHVYLDL